jgi:hypothetical protein
MKHPFVVDSCGKYVLDETLANFIAPSSKGERKNKERGPKSEPKAQKPKESHKRGKGTNYVLLCNWNLCFLWFLVAELEALLSPVASV